MNITPWKERGEWDTPFPLNTVETAMQSEIDELRAALKAQTVQEPVAWHPTEAAIAALKRFEETCADNEGYDVPKDTMRELQAVGLVYRTRGNVYCITDYGHHILAAPQPVQSPLTDEQISHLAALHLVYQIEGPKVSGVFDFARAIEAALKGKP